MRTTAKTERTIALADAMASALNSLGEPFPFVRDCIRWGQDPQELVDSMRIALQEVTPCEMVDAYLECALWSSIGDDDEPLDDSDNDPASELLDWMLADCASFVGACQDREIDPFPQGLTESGHDLWLTRNGNGFGFWDRGLGEIGDKLTEIAKLEGSRDLYVGDDGLIYC